MMKTLKNLAKVIESFSQITGKAVSWLTLAMVVLVFFIVILRYIFDIGSISLQETVTYLHGMVFLLGAAYTLQQNEHVRVDVFYSSMSHRSRAWVDLFGTIVFLFPVSLFIFYMSLDYVLVSIRINESSSEAGGLSNLYLLKSLILLMPCLLMLQGLAWIIRCALFLFSDGQSPYETKDNEHEALN
jgi:TRAP-type mannitol/chloroaromatic compound transport system permease small subunit